MYDFIIRGGMIVGESVLEPNPCLAVSQGKIKFISPGEKTVANETLDAEELYITPGFIDLHAHGGDGADALDITRDALDRISLFHGKHGTTGMLPTIAASTPERMALALEAVAGYSGREKGARFLGSHLEGPYLNPYLNGALNRDYLRTPDLNEIEEFLAAGSGTLKMVTLAPELAGSLKIIEILSSIGVIPSLGHSRATFVETISAVEAGLKHITHIYNAMAGMHHREPGPVGAALSSQVLSVDVIADGLHIHPCVLKMLWQLKKDCLTLISDAISAAGLPDGSYRFSGQEISVTGGRAATNCGKLAGSTITVLEAVKNMIKFAGLTLPQAVALASKNPARILGLSGKGRIASGSDADIVLLDAKFDPYLVMISGEVIFRKDF